MVGDEEPGDLEPGKMATRMLKSHSFEHKNFAKSRETHTAVNSTNKIRHHGVIFCLQILALFKLFIEM